MNGNGDNVETRQGRVVAVSVVVYLQEIGTRKAVPRIVPMTPKQSVSLLNFVKHRLHGGRLVLEAPPEEERKIITL